MSTMPTTDASPGRIRSNNKSRIREQQQSSVNDGQGGTIRTITSLVLQYSPGPTKFLFAMFFIAITNIFIMEYLYPHHHNLTDAKLSLLKFTSRGGVKNETLSSIVDNQNERILRTANAKETTNNTTTTERQKQNASPITPPQPPPEPPSKLNILLLYADDWRYDTLGSAGNPIVKTPFLDKLASLGVRFTHNCVTTSVCWVSRATLQTGQYLSRHKYAFFSWGATQPYARWDETYNGMLRKAGYHLGHVGKWQFHKFPDDKYNFGRVYSEKHFMSRGGKTYHVTELNRLDALEFLQKRPRDKPFCLTVAFFATHAEDDHPQQFLPQSSSMSLYVNDTVPKPPTMTEEDWRKMPPFFGETNEARIRYHWRFDEEEKRQTMMKNYYRMASEVDKASEDLVKELERQGALDNTMVIFTTDNGYFHGEHGLADKWYPHQESVRVPLIIKDPRMDPNKIGSLNDELTLNVDLAPTIVAAAGLDVPDVMQGEDISKLYRPNTSTNNTPVEWRKSFFYEHPFITSQERVPSSQALITKDYKLIKWPAYGVTQFFDLRKDPLEQHDLIHDDDYKTKIRFMKKDFISHRLDAL